MAQQQVTMTFKNVKQRGVHLPEGWRAAMQALVLPHKAKRSADQANQDLTDDLLNCKVLGIARSDQADAEATWKAEEHSAELRGRDVDVVVASSGFEANPFKWGVNLRTANVTVAWSATSIGAESERQAR